MLSLISVHMDLHCAYKGLVRPQFKKLFMTIYDVQVIPYWMDVLSYTDPRWKSWKVTLSTSYEKRIDVNVPLILFEFFFFRLACRPLRCSSHSQSCLCLVSSKTGLRREQVAREAVATERYRQQEERDIDRGSSTREDGQYSGSHCVLLIVVLSCLLLSLVVLVLSGVMLSLSKK